MYVILLKNPTICKKNKLLLKLGQNHVELKNKFLINIQHTVYLKINVEY